MKTMSKILAAILIVVLCVSVFTVQAFAEGHDASHDAGGYTSVPAKAPTCTEDGYEAYSYCNTCGQKFDGSGNWIDAPVVDPATGHTVGTDTSKTASCFQAGEDSFICATCGEQVVTATYPQLVHTPGAPIAATVGADCKTNGTITYYTCTNCGASINASGKMLSPAEINSGEKGAHTWGAWTEVKAASATSAGKQIRICSTCGETEEMVIPATGVPANTDFLYPLIASRDTYFRGEELPSFWSDLIGKLNEASGPNRNDVGVRIGTSQSMYANSYDTFDFWSSGNTITLGQKLVNNLDAGTYYVWVYNKNDPNEHTDSIPWYIVDVPTLEPINTDRHVVNSTKNLRFRASEPITASSVKVGGKSLYDANYYYVSNDGLTITLSPDFLNERQVGTYTISANTVANGTKVSCNFYIQSTASGYGSSTSPRTGDESQLGLWAAFLLLSGAAVVVLVPKIRKHGA